eukprot:CAMPEP_0178956146 /NCGR_PEP_ID=MMETSP0789-20121207/10051_1 /TAXON_ID=3005 /ORGANISM="Rhizosolenia setigera, Strain CCMP 1694" /LENGTH=183 /DNA_ID=CAMNT_0020637961 /DNA_START=379 /DNA_END=930 /DNA_ORIENTATION=+
MINYALIEKGTPAIMNFLKFRMESSSKSSKSSDRNNKDQNDKKGRVVKTESVHHQVVQEKKKETVQEEKVTKKQNNNDYKYDNVGHQSTIKPHKKSTNVSLPLPSTSNTTTTPSPSINDSSLIIPNELSKEIDELKSQIENGFSSLSQAKLYALKKKLAMARAKYIREERRFKQQQAQEGQKN